MIWALVTLIAAAAQTGRNAAQQGLTRAIGTLGATQVRFLFGLPFACLFLVGVVLATGEALPHPDFGVLGFTLMGAAAQIGATALMLVTMKRANFAVTTAWLKTEPVLVALVSAALLAEVPGPLAMAAIAVAVAGVLVMTVKPGTRLGDMRAAGTGLVAAGLFGLSAVAFRGAILGLEGGYLIRASSVLVVSLAMQTGMLLIWLGMFNRQALMASFSVWRQSLTAGFLGAFASQFWFLGFSLTSAANVRTLALVEVIFAQALAMRMGQKTTKRQMLGMALILGGVAGLLRQ
ncbi:EamA/RhaT family transporter [Rhodobacter sp. KR11]|uniref:EamA/RhaT family transporter n=1 Tax=Rhodobacter sp. KR11 TaxID=2974588 RepID=UPI00222393A4|nr:EamA/RhaT family transporter [Rhodobacter sp. KR11]MCW1919127.1 EamA/RhaT family transporter [Rhodobacter sp. KR11]